MSYLTEQQRGDLAEAMLPVAAELSVIVHGDGGPEDVAKILGRLDDSQRTALLVVLAGLVNPDRSLKESLAWLRFDEYGERAPQSFASSTRQVRDLAEPKVGQRPRGIDEVAIERVLRGGSGDLNARERTAAVDRGVRRGMTYDQVAELLGMNREAVKRSWERSKGRARANGLPVPDCPVGEIAS